MRGWLFAGLALLLGACAEFPASPADPAATAPLGPPLDAFVASGRASLRQGARSDHLKFVWQHTPQRDELSLQTPLGQGMAELVRDAHGARMQIAGREPVAATDLRALAELLFGREVPLDALPDWLRGRHPERDKTVEAWRVTVTDSVLVAGHRLPRVLQVAQGDIELRLVVDDWGDKE